MTTTETHLAPGVTVALGLMRHRRATQPQHQQPFWDTAEVLLLALSGYLLLEEPEGIARTSKRLGELSAILGPPARNIVVRLFRAHNIRETI